MGGAVEVAQVQHGLIGSANFEFGVGNRVWFLRCKLQRFLQSGSCSKDELEITLFPSPPLIRQSSAYKTFTNCDAQLGVHLKHF